MRASIRLQRTCTLLAQRLLRGDEEFFAREEPAIARDVSEAGLRGDGLDLGLEPRVLGETQLVDLLRGPRWS